VHITAFSLEGECFFPDTVYATFSRCLSLPNISVN